MYDFEKMGASRKVLDKLRDDPNSLSTTMLINPEVLGDMSPSLPYNFPKELIPNEICQKQMQTLLSCLMDNEFDNVKCEEFQFNFFGCKKWRDALLFKRIKEWEVDTFTKMKEEDKSIHLDSLKIKKLEYIDLYEKIEVTPQNRNKRNRISSDIEQMNWRINYLIHLDKEKNSKV